MKLLHLTKKLRVLASWTLDLLFGTEIEQLVTLRDVEAVTQWLRRRRDAPVPGVKAAHGVRTVGR